MSRNSLRFRLTIVFALANFLIVLVVCAIVVMLMSMYEERVAKGMLQEEALQVSIELAHSKWDVSKIARGPECTWLSRQIRERSSRAQTKRRTPWGIFGNYSASKEFSVLIVDSTRKLIYKDPGDVPPPPPSTDSSWRSVHLNSGDYTIIVGVPWDSVKRRLNYETTILLVVGFILVILAALGVWATIGRTLSPILMLSEQARMAASSANQVSLQAPSDDREIVELVDTINGLLQHLSDIADSNARFSAAASHELRTPLQGLLGHLDVALSHQRTQEQYVAFVEEARNQARRLAGIVRDLLLLSQIENGNLRHDVELFDLSDVCEGHVERTRPAFNQRGIEVSIKLQDGIVISTPESHLDMLVRNLIDNASKYSSPGGKVIVETCASGNESMLEVFNSFPADTKLDLAKMLEPFSRADSPASFSTGGTGLGLAICHAVARDNGWRLELSQDSKGVKAKVTFPQDASIV